MLGFLLGRPYYMGTSPVPPAVQVGRGEMVDVQHRLDSLELACAGLWKLLKDKHGYTNEELTAAVNAVDAEDGKIDGRIMPVQSSCPQCHRPLLSRTSVKCLWCGAVLGNSPLISGQKA